MNKITSLGLALAVSLLPSLGAAKPGNQAQVTLPITAADGTSFSAEDMTTPAQTNVLDVRGFTWVTFYVSAAAVSGTANVTINCNTGPSDSDVNYALQSESVASGVATFSDYVPTKSVTTSDKFPVTISVLNKDYLQCTFTCASGTVDVIGRAW